MIFRLPLGYVWNSAWCGFGPKRDKDGHIWWLQLWHPTRSNLLVSNNAFIRT